MFPSDLVGFKSDLTTVTPGEMEFLRHGGDRVMRMQERHIAPVPPETVGRFSEGQFPSGTIDQIDQLDLSCVKEKLQEKHKWSVERCEAAQKDYLRFLKLALLERGKEISPLGDIDEMWHTHILFTKKYHQDCQKIFGQYMHHNPLIGEKDAERLRKGRASTRALFLKHFGECTELQDSCGCGNSGGNCCGNDS